MGFTIGSEIGLKNSIYHRRAINNRSLIVTAIFKALERFSNSNHSQIVTVVENWILFFKELEGISNSLQATLIEYN